MDDVVISSGTTAVIVAYLLQALKNAKFSDGWINQNTARMNFALSVLVAGLSAVGISYKFDLDPEKGTFIFALSGSLAGFVHGLAHWAVQWAGQHVAYKSIVVPAETLSQMLAALRTLIGQPPAPPKT